VGDIQIDSEMVKQLMDTGRFETMSHKVDEDEHSMEMHLPYIAHRMKGKDFTLVPILVGNLSVDSEIAYGKLLAPYLSDPRNFFIISSDFCHWGKRFRFQWYIIQTFVYPFNVHDSTQVREKTWCNLAVDREAGQDGHGSDRKTG